MSCGRSGLYRRCAASGRVHNGWSEWIFGIKRREITGLLVSLLACQSAGVLGLLFTHPALRSWYPWLKRPSFQPPNWLFAPVWTALYAMMGSAVFLVWRKVPNDRRASRAVDFFGVQLTFNSLWSVVFFGLRSPLAGLAEISVLWVALIATVIKFFRISKPAGFLLIPYLLWTSFATVLNFSIWRLNR